MNMTDPTAYHRKLAEAMEQVASGYDMSHGITAKSTRKDRVDHFAAVLASEGVVDNGKYWEQVKVANDAEAEVKRLKAGQLTAVDDATEMAINSRYNAGMEAAAKIADSNAHEDCDVAEVIAAAIRAGIK